MSIRRMRSLDLSIMGHTIKGVLGQSAGLDYAALIEADEGPEEAARIIKAAVGGISTDGGLGVYRDAIDAILAAAQHHGLWERGLPFMLRGAPFTRYGLLTAIAGATHVDEAMSIPVSKGTAANKSLHPRKVVVIIVTTKEFLRFVDAGQLSQAFALALGAAVDVQFAAHCLSVGTAVAALGQDARGVYVDLKRGLSALPTSAGSEIIIGMSPALAKRVAALPTTTGGRAFSGMTPNGGELAGMQCVATDALTNDVVLYDATSFLGFSGEVEMDRADQTTLEMATDPTSAASTGSPPAPVETTQVSMFQTNSVGLMARREFAFEPIRAGVVKITGAGNLWGYDTTTSPPL